MITPTPDPPQAGLLEQILGSYTTRFTTGTNPLPQDEPQVLAEAIHQLRRHANPHPPQAVLAIALRVGWPGKAAWDLHHLLTEWNAAKNAGAPQPARRTSSI